MSERFGACRACAGVGFVKDPIDSTWVQCCECLETGFSGRADDYWKVEQEKDHAFMDGVRAVLDAMDRSR
jgi:hypothetical protein